MSLGRWLTNAVQASGREAGSLAGAVGRKTGEIGRAAGHTFSKLEHDASHIPVLGPLLHGTLLLTENAIAGPFIITYKVARGERIDRALVSHLRREIKGIREVGPYAQAVISFVPGIGPGISAGIGAGLALASGQPISQVVLAAVRGAVPGGALAQMAFDMGHAALSGKRIEDIIATGAMDGLGALGVQIPEEAKKAIMTGLHAASKIARGERVDQALADSAIEGLGAIPGMPPAAAKAIKTGIKTGMALAHGKRLQDALGEAIPGAIGALMDLGAGAVKASPTLHAASSLFPPEATRAFHVAVGLMKHNVGAVEITTARSHIEPKDRVAFDAAIALQIGDTTHAVVPPALSPSERAGYLIVKGMQGATEEQRVSLMKFLANDPEARRGAIVAVKEVASAREPWWTQFKEALGLAA